MKDVTKDWPVGCTGYTVVDISDWNSEEWWSKETEMLDWLRTYDHPSWFAWERPNGTMVFEDNKMATLFVMRWS